MYVPVLKGKLLQHYKWSEMDKRISGEMVRVFVLSAVDRRLDPQWGKTKTIKLVFTARSFKKQEQRLIGSESE